MRSLKAGQNRRLALRQQEDGEEIMVNINTTPLIDVMLVLLVMLIITIPLQTQSVQLALGRGTPPATEQQPPMVTIGVDFDNTLSVEGNPVPNEEALQKRFQEIAGLPDQPVVVIKPNRLSDYKVVAFLLADAQRIGIKKITIANQN